MKPIYIIAEAGVNHNGNIDLAYKLVDLAVAAEADAVKFQTFVADSLVTKSAKKADYQIESCDSEETQYSMLKRLELKQSEFLDLQKYCLEKKIDFLSTAFDQESLNFLYKDLKLPILKIPSGELTNAPFVLEHAKTGCDLILSTGMADIKEIKMALSVIAYGLLNKTDRSTPSIASFKKAYKSKEGQEALIKKITILHCTTQYPTPLEDVNLHAIETIRNSLGLRVGYSDHTQGITVPIAAAALGATIIEKHFTIDCNMDGPDHRASLNPKKLKEMIKAIRSTELALGSHRKKIAESENLNKAVIRKSIVATQDIKKGDTLNETNIGIMRPGKGLSPYLYWEIIGSKARSQFKIGDYIE
jgi:N-acetylneuraminate synthase